MFRKLRAANEVLCRAARGCRIFVCLFVLCSFTGCNDYGPPKNTAGLEDLQPVTGSVSFEGQPTQGAHVQFVEASDPESTDRQIAAVVEEDGSFEVRTAVGAGSRPGARPGEYVVTISWNQRENPRDRDSDMGPDLLPAKYKDHKTSDLRVEVLEGTNELHPFELTP